MTTQLEQAWELAKQRFAAVGIDVGRCASSIACRSPCTVGRAMMLPDSRTRKVR